MASAFKRKHQRVDGGTWTACWVDESGRRCYKAVTTDKATEGSRRSGASTQPDGKGESNGHSA